MIKVLQVNMPEEIPELKNIEKLVETDFIGEKKRYIPLDNKMSEDELDRLNMLLENSENFGEFSQRAKEEMGIDKYDAKDVWTARWDCYQ